MYKGLPYDPSGLGLDRLCCSIVWSFWLWVMLGYETMIGYCDGVFDYSNPFRNYVLHTADDKKKSIITYIMIQYIVNLSLIVTWWVKAMVMGMVMVI